MSNEKCAWKEKQKHITLFSLFNFRNYLYLGHEFWEVRSRDPLIMTALYLQVKYYTDSNSLILPSGEYRITYTNQ